MGTSRATRPEAALKAVLSQPTIPIPDYMALSGLGESTVRYKIKNGEIKVLDGSHRTYRILSAPVRKALALDDD